MASKRERIRAPKSKAEFDRMVGKDYVADVTTGPKRSSGQKGRRKKK